MKQTNTDTKPRAYGVAMAICAQFPQFARTINPQDGISEVHCALRRRDGAQLHITHHPTWTKGQRDIRISPMKIPEAPYGLVEPTAIYSGAGMTDTDIAFDFAMNHYEAMQQYWLVALDARQKTLDRYNDRLAFAHKLAEAGDGTARNAVRNSTPDHVPSLSDIDCFANKTCAWRVKNFGQENELIVRATDAQALAIVAMLAEKPN